MGGEGREERGVKEWSGVEREGEGKGEKWRGGKREGKEREERRGGSNNPPAILHPPGMWYVYTLHRNAPVAHSPSHLITSDSTLTSEGEQEALFFHQTLIHTAVL